MVVTRNPQEGEWEGGEQLGLETSGPEKVAEEGRQEGEKPSVAPGCIGEGLLSCFGTQPPVPHS